MANPDQDRGPAVAATATESRVSGDNSDNSNTNNKTDDGITSFKPSPRFWVILVTCAVMGLLSALENTVVTTALPHIVADLDMGENYVWITNVFFLTGYVSGRPCRSCRVVSTTRGPPHLWA